MIGQSNKIIYFRIKNRLTTGLMKFIKLARSKFKISQTMSVIS
jgi:hypothetical protein